MTSGRDWLNRLNGVLGRANLRLDTMTLDEAEDRRLRALDEGGHFERAVFPVPASFDACPMDAVLEEVTHHGDRLRDFSDPARNDVGYAYDNPYFRSPDAEVLYAMIRRFKPRRVVEVGSGYSTRIIRQAIIDGGAPTRLVSIDPAPRLDVPGFADEVRAVTVESCESEVFDALDDDDVLFVDSSHVVATGNDVVRLYLQVIPTLKPGVLIHVHDIFLPYDYPREWVIGQRWQWSEQYLVQALLTFGGGLDVIWPGHYLQRTRPDFARHFPHLGAYSAQSLWLRRIDREMNRSAFDGVGR